MSKYFSRDKWQYFLRMIGHPADSFYEIRYREHGSVPIALICVFFFGLMFTVNRILASFVVNDVDPRSIDGLTEMGAVFLLVILFATGNWSVTCLMDGEGRYKDIITVTGYAFLPLGVMLIPATLISQVVAAGEEVFYTVAIVLGIAWTAILLLVGIMTIHNYSLGKTLITLFLTVVAMFILIFLALLLLDLINQVIMFFQSIYTELIYR